MRYVRFAAEHPAHFQVMFSPGLLRARWSRADAPMRLERYSLPVSELEGPDVLRRGLDALCRKVDGSAAAAKTVKRKEAAVNEVFGVAVEKGYFGQNPLAGLRWSAPEVADEVDPECVPNPAQVARLLAAVKALPGRGPHLYAFLGCMYYAAMRPAEVIHLQKSQCRLPATGWGR